MLKNIEGAKGMGHKKTKSHTNFSNHMRGFSMFDEPGTSKHKPKPSKQFIKDDFMEFSGQESARKNEISRRDNSSKSKDSTAEASKQGGKGKAAGPKGGAQRFMS